MNDTVPITGNDLWVKVVGMLQQNWASIEAAEGCVVILFITDTSQVFDRLPFNSIADAEAALARNGFRRLHDAPDLQGVLRAPVAPFFEGRHPNGPIYSSGRFWR